MMRTWLAASGPVLVWVLAACGSDDPVVPPGPAPVATVEVSLSAGLLIGDTATAVATLRDANGNVLTGRSVVFSTSNALVASVDVNGFVRALQVGPVTITATSETRNGTANVTVRDDQRFGYVWANDGAAAAYTPTHAWVFSTGGAVNIVRNGTGDYSVRFVGLGSQPPLRENVQVTAYVDLRYCGTSGWQTQGTDLVVGVRCWAVNGAAADSRYTVLVSGARALSGRTGFLLADQPAATGPYRPSSPHNSSNGAVTVARQSAGVYRVSLPGLGRATGSGTEMVMVTQVGTGTDRCLVSFWDAAAFASTVLCTDRAGNPIDARFSLLVLERGRAGRRTGFAWANNPTAASYTPDPLYSHNSGGAAVTAARLGPGNYLIRWTNLLKVGTETVLVTAYGAANRWCRAGGWGDVSATEFGVGVNCFDAAGNPADAQYDIIVIQ